MKRIMILFLSLLLTITVTGCGKQRIAPGGPPDNSSAISDNNPFQSGDEASGGVLGSIGHGPVNPNRDGSGNMLPFVYDGGEMSIAYTVNASGKAKNVGFLVFVDGISQPYKIDSDDAYKTMHILNLEKDDTDYPFSIIFDPVAGEKEKPCP